VSEDANNGDPKRHYQTMDWTHLTLRTSLSHSEMHYPPSTFTDKA